MTKKLEEAIKLLEQKIKEWEPYKKIEFTTSIEKQISKENKAIETVLQALIRSNNENESQKYLIQEREQEIIELNQKCILEKVAKEEIEKLLENSIPKEEIEEKINYYKGAVNNEDYKKLYNSCIADTEIIIEFLQELLEENKND